ncbi:PqqD family protein [Methanobrevibacter ruminantium]|uniref:PqqD family protein n=1 Tax=Methanobrevibacter ruminantium TaxID=83816 RepID=UPI0026F14EE3|nr:PqqD family protein [Methanobrevibacter ruminantium]
MIVVNDIVNIGNDFSLVALEKEFFFLPNSTDGITEEKLYALNPTAYFVASYIDGKRTVEDIINLLCSKTSVDKEIAENDVLELMNSLLENKIIYKK